MDGLFSRGAKRYNKMDILKMGFRIDDGRFAFLRSAM